MDKSFYGARRSQLRSKTSLPVQEKHKTNESCLPFHMGNKSERPLCLFNKGVRKMDAPVPLPASHETDGASPTPNSQDKGTNISLPFQLRHTRNEKLFAPSVKAQEI